MIEKDDAIFVVMWSDAMGWHWFHGIVLSIDDQYTVQVRDTCDPSMNGDIRRMPRDRLRTEDEHAARVLAR